MIIANFIIQLALKHISKVAPIIQDLYSRAERGRRRSTSRELASALQQAILGFKRIFIVIDALDECDSATRRQLPNALDLTSNSNIHVIIFSRPHIQLQIYTSKMHNQMAEIEIQATASDLHLFVDSRITEIEDLESVVDSCELTIEQIADMVVAKASFR